MQSFFKRGILTIVLAAFMAVSYGSMAMAEKSIVVGGKNYTEQYLYSELTRQLLVKNGFDVKMKNGVGTAISRKSLETSQTDIYYEFTGTAYTLFFKGKDNEVMVDSQRIYDFVKDKDAEKGLIWLERAALNNTYTLMMRKDDAANLNIKTISELGAYVKKHPKKLTFAVDSEFWERPDGIKKLMKVYGFRIPTSNVKKMGIGITYMALKKSQVDVSMGFSTDGRILAFGLVNIDDDLKFFPVYNPAPVVRKEILEKYPELPGILNPMTQLLTSAEMMKMNSTVDVDHKSVEETAKAWLTEKGLL